MNLYEIGAMFLIFGFLGWCAEVAFAAVKEKHFVNRGFLNGPICPIYGAGVVAMVLLLEPFQDNVVILYFGSVIITTLLELVTGYLLEKIFHHRWWDYSGMPLNIGGYVCLVFSLVWGFGCVFIMKAIYPLFLRFIRWVPYNFGLIILIMLAVVFVVDAVLTVTTILKFNKRIRQIDALSSEIRRISDGIGAAISDSTLEIYDRSADLRTSVSDKKEELTDSFDDMKENLSKELELKRQQLDDLMHKRHKVSDRLMKAFPKMKSVRYEETLQKIKSAMNEYTSQKREEKKHKNHTEQEK